jgi:hypothetical protein
LLLLAQATARPVSGVPTESLVAAVSCCVPPTLSVAVLGLTATVATGTSVTVRAALALFPSLAAVIVAEPGATAVSRPLALTLATD